MPGLSVSPTGGWVDPTGFTFSPLNISGLQLWLDAGQITGLADGAAVTTWSDLSGNGNDATQATADNKPLYKTSIINGRSVVRFDGSNDYLQVAFTLIQPVCVFAVLAFTGAPPAPNPTAFDGATFNTMRLYRDFFAPNDMRIFAGSSVGPATTTPLSWHIYTCIFNTTSSDLVVDGTSAATGGVGSSNGGGLTLGARGNGTEAGNLDIAEVILYSSIPSLGSRGRLHRYLSSKYAIALP